MLHVLLEILNPLNELILNISNNCITRCNCKQLNIIYNYDNTTKNIINNRSINI